MFRIYPGEIFKDVDLKYTLQKKYAVSNRGRFVSYIDELKNGTELKGSTIENYRVFSLRVTEDGKRRNKTLFLHKMVAELFAEKRDPDQVHVIHLDHDRTNNDARNLKWVNQKDQLSHHSTSPRVIKARQKWSESNYKLTGHKLSATEVMRLKKLIHDPNRKTRLKMIAKQFGISEMQLYRVKRGENWNNIEI
ncbi:MAG: HNH endonuclease [Flavobacterium sp.]|nr:HNH endonuclease [Flavobacterium sp.]